MLILLNIFYRSCIMNYINKGEVYFMLHESDDKNNVKIENSNLLFSNIQSMPYTPIEYIESIKKSNVLLVPCDRYNDGNWLFTEYTHEIFEYINEVDDDDIKMDICISDEEYKKLELHSEVINLGIFLVTNIVFPTLVGILSSFLYDKIKKYHKKPTETNTNVEVIVEKNGKSKKVIYRGTIENFEKTMKSIKDTIFEE